MNDFTALFPPTFRLRKGNGRGDPSDGLCLLETTALIAGEPIKDQPDCCCLTLAWVGININDLIDAEHRQSLLPFAIALAGSRSKAHERKRLRILCEWLEPHAGRARAWKYHLSEPYHSVDPLRAAIMNEFTNALLYRKYQSPDEVIDLFRRMIDAGPHGAYTLEEIAPRVDAVRDRLPVSEVAA